MPGAEVEAEAQDEVNEAEAQDEANVAIAARDDHQP